MAKNTNANPEADANKNPDPNPAPEQPKVPEFTIARLREDCRKLFGVTTCCYDAAVNGVKSDKKFTVAAMKAHIEEWKVKPAVPKKK